MSPTSSAAGSTASPSGRPARPVVATVGGRIASTPTPIAGQLTQLRVLTGDYVKANETVLAVVVQTDPIAATFAVDERTYLKIRRLAIEKKVPGDLKLPVHIGLANTSDFPYRGETRIGFARFDPATGTTQLTANIPNPDGAISPGNFARVRLETGEFHDRWSVPMSAIGYDGETLITYIKVLDANDRVTRRTVTVVPLPQPNGLVFVEGVSAEDRLLVVFNGPGGAVGETVKPRLVPTKS